MLGRRAAVRHLSAPELAGMLQKRTVSTHRARTLWSTRCGIAWRGHIYRRRAGAAVTGC